MNTGSNWVFKDEYLLTWPLYQELNATLFHNTARYRIRQIVGLFLCTTVLYAALRIPSVVYGLWIGLILGFLIEWIRKRTTKDGDRHYKKLIQNNSGKTPYNVHTYDESNIISTDQNTKTQKIISYSQIERIIESKRLFLLIANTKDCIIVDTQFLSGGNRDEFRSFITKQCPHIRGKIRRGTFSRILETLLKLFPIAAIAITFLDLSPGLLQHTNGTLANDLTYREIAAGLNELGIVCSEDSIQQIEEMEESYKEMGIYDFYSDYTTQDRVISLLSWVGYGSYDFETLEWSPSSSGVYCVDMEAFAIDTMYTDYLKGIESISCGELLFSTIEETYDSVNWENGTGFGHLTFSLGGKTHHVLLEVDLDWYSTDALNRIGTIINSQNTEKKLYYLSDSGQGILIFYRDSQWAKAFTDLTGLHLTDNFNKAISQTLF